MFARISLVAVLLLSSAASSFAADPTLEELRLDPSKYAGQTIALDQVRIFGNLNRKDKDAWLHLISAVGKVDRVGDGPRFMLTSTLADEMTRAKANGFKMDGKFHATCTIKKTDGQFSFTITRIKFYNKNATTVMRVFGE